jgi:3-dehydroquinate dehydratase-1
MTAWSAVKGSKAHAQIVGVIASRADLLFAARMSRPPDLFELRLDHLGGCLDELEKKMSILRAPFIITARHPVEGGANRLPAERRRELLFRFLTRAHFVDLELRSAKRLRLVLDLARRKNIRRIISFHDFNNTPSVRVLKAKARAAKSTGADIFKVATRTDTPAQLERLLDFFASNDVDLAIAAMGMGKLGAVSRLILTQLGSVLVYGSLRRPTIEGQLSVQQLRSALVALRVHQGGKEK